MSDITWDVEGGGNQGLEAGLTTGTVVKKGL